MILVDTRAGSKDYIPLLRALGAPVDEVQMDFGDVAFWGGGRAVGIELKKFDDVLQCLTTGRLAGHQLPGMAEHYRDDTWLIIEGLWRPNPDDGVLEVWGWSQELKKMTWVPAGKGKRRWMYRQFDSYLLTMEVKGGLRLKRTMTEDETARVVLDIYHWYQNFDGHRSHLAENRAGRDNAIFFKSPFAQRVARDLDGVDEKRSAEIVKVFPTVVDMVCATEKEWRKVKGIGKTLAQKIVAAWSSAE